MSHSARLLVVTLAFVSLCAAVPLSAQSYCASSSTNMTYEWISRVEINGAERTSGKEGFNDQSGTSLTTLAIGGTYPVEVDVSTGGGPWLEYVKIWFDLNHDGVFADPGELIFNESKTVPANSMSTFLANIVLPSCSLPGPTRLRIIMQYNGKPSLCGTYTYGETEDYLVSVTGSEATPTSADGAFSIAEDSTYPFGASSFPFSDTDAGQSMKSVIIASLPTSGQLRLNGSAVSAGQAITAADVTAGRLVFHPPANASGTPLGSFTFRVTDCVDKESPAYTMTANVSAVADAPTISSIANQTMNENESLGPLVFTVGDVDTGTDSVTVTAGSSNTTVIPLSSIQTSGTGANRTITITPPPNLFGTSTITLTASDGGLTSSTSFVLTVNGVNDAPVAGDDSATTAEDTLLSIPFSALLTNDTDVEGDSLTIVAVSSPSSSGGSVSIASAASRIDYQPAADFNGVDSFTCTVSDGKGGTDTATVQVEVTPVDDAPSLSSIADQTVDENDTLGPIPFTVGDVESGASAVVVSVESSDGTIAPLSGISLGGSNASRTITVTPSPNKFGTVTITLTATVDGLATTRSFVLTVNGVNDTPVLATNVGATLAQGETSTISGSMLRVTDIDNTASEITYQITTPPSLGALRSGATALGAGSFFTQAMIDAGAISYANDGNGPTSDTFRFTVSDGSGGTIPETAFTLSVQPRLSIGDLVVTETAGASLASIPVTMSDVWPAAVGVSWTTLDGSAISGTDYLADSGTVTIPAGSTSIAIPVTILGDELMKLPRAFQVAISSPSIGTIGDASAAITIEDDDPMPSLSISGGSGPEGHSAASSATFTVSLSLPSGLDVTFDYATLDGDAISPEDFGTMSGSHTIPAGQPSVTIEVPVSGDHDVENDESFSLHLSNASYATITVASASWAILSDDHVPVVADDSSSVDEDETLVVAAPGLLANDDDTDGDPLTVSILSEPSYGALVAGSDGSFSYAADADYHGTDNFTYRVNDGHFESNVATVNLTINSVNDSPVAASDDATTPEDTPLTMAATALLSNDSDTEDDSLTVIGVGSPSTNGGTVTLAGGRVTYEPAADFGGTDSFTYTVADGNGGIATGTVLVEVTRLANVSVSIVGPDEVTPGTESSWTVTLFNAGPSDAEGLTVLVPLPAGLVLAGSGCSPCEPVTLAEGATSSIELTYRIPSSRPSPGSFAIEASMTTSTPENTPADNAASFPVNLTSPVADLAIAITAPEIMIPGTDAQLVVTVTNTGPSDAPSASLTIVLPESFLETTRSSSADVGGATGGWSLAAGGSVSWTLDGRIDPAARGTADVSASVSLSAPAIDPVAASDIASHSAQLQALVSLVPTITHDSEPAVLDREVEWTLRITNEGPSTATGLGFSLTAVALELGVPDTGTLASLQPGESATVAITSIATTLPRATLAASVTVTEPADGEAKATDEVAVRVPLADLRASVTSAVPATRVGERFPLEIIVTNDGPEEAIDATLTLEREIRAHLESLTIAESAVTNPSLVSLGTIEAGDSVVLRGEALTRESGTVELTLRSTSGWDDPASDTGSATLRLDATTTTTTTIIPLGEDGFDPSGRERRTVVMISNLGFMPTRVVLEQTAATGGDPLVEMNWLAAGESYSTETPMALQPTGRSPVQSGWIVATADDVSRIGSFKSAAWIDTNANGLTSTCLVGAGELTHDDVWLHGLISDASRRAIVAIVNTDSARSLGIDLEIHPADGSGAAARTTRVTLAPGELQMIEALDLVGLERASVRVHPRIPVPHLARFVAWSMSEDRNSGDRAWRNPSVGTEGATERLTVIPPASGDDLLLTVVNPSTTPANVRLTVDGHVDRELALGAREVREIDLAGLALESLHRLLRVTFFDGAGAREGLAWAVSRRGAEGGGWLFEEAPLPFVHGGIAAGTVHPGQIEAARTARLLVVNPDDDVVHVTLSILDATDGAVTRTLTALVGGRQAANLPDIASWLRQRPGYVRIETSDGRRIHADLLIEPLEVDRSRVDTLRLPVTAAE